MNKKEIAKSVKDLVDKGGKVGADVKVNIFSEKRVPLPPNIMVFQTFAFLAATELKPATNKVLMMFFASSGYENFVSMDIKTISEKLNISERTVNTAIVELTLHNIIIKTQNTQDKRRQDYFLNPLSSWKGNSKSRKKLIEMLPDNQLSMFGVEGFDIIERERLEIKNKQPFLKNVKSLKKVKSIDPKEAF